MVIEIRKPPPWIIGHRGAAAEAVENTLASFALAVEQQADMIELDVQLTSDGQLAVFHDWSLERFGGHSAVVEDEPFESLVGLFPDLVGLARVFDEIPHDLPVNVELKRRHAAAAPFARALSKVVAQRPGVVISSFDWELLGTVKTVLPAMPVSPLSGDAPEDLLEAAESLGAWGVHCHHEIASPDLVERARAADRPVLTYTVNDAVLARELFARGVAGVFTDAPGRLREALGPAGPLHKNS